MAFLGRLQCPAPALVPAVYRGTATASMAAPSEGVEVVVATASHLLELAEGLVVRCCALPRGLEVDEVGRVEGLVGGWSYLLQGHGMVAFVDGERMEVRERRYTGVEEVEVGDFLDTGECLVRLGLGVEGEVVTDGQVELDMAAPWPPEGGGRQVEGVLERRVAEVRRAVVRAREEKEVAGRRVEEAIALLSRKMVPCSVVGREELEGRVREN